MAFAKKTWKDRIAEFPTRRRLTKEDNTSELVTVAREEGTLSQEGDAFSAENMNDLESRIDVEFTELNGKLNHVYGKVVLSNPFVVWTTNSLIKFNGIVICSLSFTSTSNLITNTEIKVGNVPDLFKPLSRQSVSSSDGCVFAIDTNGKISYVPNTAKPYSSIAIVYVTDYL